MSSKEQAQIDKRTKWALLAGVSLISFGLLSFEIALTRVLSVMLSYHYVFIVVSLALLGLGLGGVFVHIFKPRTAHERPLSFTVLLASLFSLSIPLSLIAITRIAWVTALQGNILPYLLILEIPFFLAGALFADIFRGMPALSARLYGMDLIGAATGSMGAVFLLNIFGGVDGIFVVSVIVGVAALLLTLAVARRDAKQVTLSLVSLLVVLGLLGTDLTGLFRPGVAADPAKEISRALNGPTRQAKIVETKWSAFGRTDLVAASGEPDTMNIYVDGTAGSAMYRFDGDVNEPGPIIDSMKTEFPAYLPLSVLQNEEKDSALIIGPGGGRDVLLALLGGVKRITAVEVNPEVVEIMQEYAWYNGGLYTDRDDVTIVVDEGRNFLKRQEGKYDLIMLSLPITKTSRSPEGYALTENFLFTTDSITDYIQHLTDEGRLVVVAHDAVEMSKLLSLSVNALTQQGVSTEEAMRRVYVIGSHMYPVLVLKRTPLEPKEMETVHRAIHELQYDAATSYLPTIRPGECTPHEQGTRYDECAMLNPVLIAASDGSVGFDEIETVFRKYGLDIRPVTDDNPFFYRFESGLPQPVTVVFWSSVALLLLGILVPHLYWQRRVALSRRQRESARVLPRFLALFSLLGMGFMLVEISAIQRFTLFLGQPVLSVAALLFSLLVGAGLGSLSSGRITSGKVVRSLTWVCVLIAALLVIYALLLPIILEQLLGLNLVSRISLTVALTVPLGFLMGFPFPLGLRLLKELGLQDYVPWMWGINGLASVVGSALTIIIAVTFGFTEAMLAGAAGYFLVFSAFLGFQQKTQSEPAKGVTPVPPSER